MRAASTSMTSIAKRPARSTVQFSRHHAKNDRPPQPVVASPKKAPSTILIYHKHKCFKFTKPLESKSSLGTPSPTIIRAPHIVHHIHIHNDAYSLRTDKPRVQAIMVDHLPCMPHLPSTPRTPPSCYQEELLAPRAKPSQLLRLKRMYTLPAPSTQEVLFHIAGPQWTQTSG